EHNIEYLVYKRFAENAPFFLRPLLYMDVFKLRKTEEQFWKKANFLIAVSEVKKKIMQKINKKVSTIPNGVDLDNFPMKKKNDTEKRNTVLFIGDFKWIQ